MDETPKKLKDDSNCFICLNNIQPQERIKIFGSTAADIPNLINNSIDIDVSCYNSSGAFICMKCYKYLLKFDKAVSNVEKLKKELKDIYTAVDCYRRFKRQHRSAETINVQQEPPSKTIKHVIKQLKFDNQVVGEPAKCISYSAPIGNVLNPPTELLHANSVSPLPYDGSLQLVYNAFGLPTLPAIPTGQILSRHLFTSTLVTKPSREKKSLNKTKTTVTITVEYPSKTVKETLTSEFEAIGKAIIHGPPSRIAKAVLKCEAIRTAVIEQVLRAVSNEVDNLCSKENPSLLRKNEKDDLINYDMLKLCEEWKRRAPVFYAFLLTCSTSKRNMHHSTWFPSIALSGSILLKQRNNHMSATASVIGLLLKTKSIKV